MLLGGLLAVLHGVDGMAMGVVGLFSGLGGLALSVMRGGLLVMLGSFLMVFGGLFVVLGGGMRCGGHDGPPRTVGPATSLVEPLQPQVSTNYTVGAGAAGAGLSGALWWRAGVWGVPRTIRSWRGSWRGSWPRWPRWRWGSGPDVADEDDEHSDEGKAKQDEGREDEIRHGPHLL